MLVNADGVFLVGTADTDVQIPKVRTSNFSQHYSEIRKLGRGRAEIQNWVLQDGSQLYME